MTPPEKTASAAVRIFLCLVIIAVGVSGFLFLKKLKKPPLHKPLQEQTLAVSLLQVVSRSVTIRLKGYGEVRSRTVVPLAAEVSGRVTSIHQPLEPGTLVQQGDILVTMDERDPRIEIQTAREQLKLLRRDLTLARNAYERIKLLFEKKKIGNRTEMERAEQTVNKIREQILQQEQVRQRAALHLQRCTIRAPFSGRITEVQVEKDAYISPGKKLLTLADDNDLEVIVSLDSHAALTWLSMKQTTADDRRHWFGPLEPAPCNLWWTENSTVSAAGVLDRIVRLNRQTRTLDVAIRLDGTVGKNTPLVEGMFCEAAIPGKTLTRVFVLPREAVTFEKQVYVSSNDRLQARKVNVLWEKENQVVINRGLEPGDLVITNRLDHPLPGTLLKIGKISKQQP